MKVNIIAIDQRTRAETPEGEGVELAEVIGDDDGEDIVALAAEIEAKGSAMIGGGASPLCRLERYEAKQ